MDYFDERDCLKEEIIPEGDSEIEQFYSDQEIFITGSTGFIGQLIIEKILRCIPSVKKIYLLIREKKGKSAEERIKVLLEGQVFEKMRLAHPSFMKKVTVVPGNLNQQNLGIDDEHLEKLKSVNVILHAAADLIFDEHIQTSFTSNVVATKDLIELAKKMPNLKSFVYVSTTYLYEGKTLLEEKLYGCKFSFEEASLLLKSLSGSQATAITPLLLQGYPTVYSLTKVMTETLIQNFVGVIPIGILRTSIVANTNSEPLSAWIPSSIQAATGILLGSALSFFRVHRWNEEIPLHIIPADKVANSCIAVAWDVSKSFERDCTETPVYHCVPHKYNVPTGRQLFSFGEKVTQDDDLASEKMIWCYVKIHVKSKITYWILQMLLEILPGIFFDVLLTIQGKKPILMRLYRKATPLTYIFCEKYLTEAVCFDSERIQNLWNRMTDVDKRKFDFNMVNFAVGQYCLKFTRGFKVYLLGESMENLPKARARLRRLEKLHYVLCKICQISVAFVVYKLLFPTIQFYFST